MVHGWRHEPILGETAREWAARATLPARRRQLQKPVLINRTPWVVNKSNDGRSLLGATARRKDGVSVVLLAPDRYTKTRPRTDPRRVDEMEVAMRHTDSMSGDMQKAVEDCMSCSMTCEETITYCLNQPGQIDAAMIRMMMDCAEMSKMCADMMCRMSPMHMDMCQLCTRMCMMCAEMCATSDDAQMMKLAEMCRTCADSCRAMAGAAA
jgi:hypothetical protein